MYKAAGVGQAAEVINWKVFEPKVEALDTKMERIFDQLREEGRLKKGVPSAWLNQLYAGVLFAASNALSSRTVAPRDVPHLAWQSFAHGFFEP